MSVSRCRLTPVFHRRISSRKSDYLASRGFSQRTITEQARISTLGKTEIQNKDFGKIRGFSSPFNEQGANPDNLVTVIRIQQRRKSVCERPCSTGGFQFGGFPLMLSHVTCTLAFTLRPFMIF